ncbi:transcription factor TFIIIB component B'' homolog Bdp1 [Arctopsyche grandis]|uniref:transcription factor TFIIIB component B'' homolog Bdp1 n=1 Tax=Arctopsyche grandis TaxID=121162 RepID=UPI00406DA396
MSTRRARIKAVASLPIRKRTVDSKTDSNATKEKDVEKKQLDTEQIPTVNVSSPVVNNVKNESSCDNAVPLENNTAAIEKNDASSNVSKETNHRRRIMKPSINIPNSSKRNKVPDKKEVVKHASKPNISPLKSPRISNVQVEKNIKNDTKILNNSPRISTRSEKTKNGTIDGIIPLVSPVRKEFIDENIVADTNDPTDLSTECDFDPIIPLPSPSKNRPKLKPMPRFAMRRNSFQGSASESEDDLRKTKRDEASAALPIPGNIIQPTATPTSVVRLRNDSICSLPSDSHLHVNLPLTPRQKINRTRVTAAGECRRAAAKKKVLNRFPQNPLTMCDLIYYNPPNNRKLNNNLKKFDKEPIQAKEEPSVNILNNLKKDVQQENIDKTNSMAVPQVKLGPNGEIVIDEQSLVIETTDTVKSRTEISKLSVVYENGYGSGSGLYRRTSRTHDWTDAETLRFYKALNTIGTDFALMLCLFPGRTRKDLKVKFKKEERHNIALVDRALMNPLNFDISELEAELKKEQEDLLKKTKETIKEKIQTKPNNYRKSSAAFRTLECPEKAADEEPKKKRKRSKVENENAVGEIRKSAVPDKNSPQNTTTTDDCMEELPQNVEPGSMVILVKKVPDKPGRNTLQAYVSHVNGDETEMVPVNLEINVLKSIAKEMNILRENEEYELAVDYPVIENDNGHVVLNNEEMLSIADNSEMEIDDTILNDSSIDNYILTGQKVELLSSDTLSSPNIMNLSQT